MEALVEKLPPGMRDTLAQSGPFGLAMWQWVGLLALLLLAIVVGALLGRATRSLLVSFTRRTSLAWDDALVSRLRGPLIALWAIATFALVHHALELPKTPAKVAEHALRGAFYATAFWIAGRAIGVARTVSATSSWGAAHPALRAMLPVVSRVAQVALFALALVALLSELGVPVTSVVAGLGLGGLAFALAAQKTVENVFGAFSLGADQPFVEGDFVRIDDFVGTVERIGLRSTRFRTLDRTLITIPNGKLAEMRIESFTVRDRFRFSTTLSLVYGTTPAQLRAVREAVEKLLRQHRKIWPDTVVVRIVKLGASSIDIDVMAWFQVPDWDAFQVCREESLLEIVAAVAEAGTEFAFPTQTVHVVPQRASEQDARLSAGPPS
jgi:MscS family membrane protein